MKKALSLALCILLTLSVVTVSAGAADAFDVKSALSVTKGDLVNDTITYTVNLVGGTSISNAIIKVKYDSDALTVKEAGACTTTDADGDPVPCVSGEVVSGATYADGDVYSFGYMNATTVKVGSAGKKFVYITFTVVDATMKSCDVEFICEEYNKSITKTGEPQTLLSDELILLNMPTGISAVYGSQGAVVSWSAVEGADSYNVYRKTSSSWALLASDVTETSYYDTSLTDNVTCYYTVRAKNSAGFSGYNKTGIKFTYLAAPKTVTPTYTSGGIKVTWSAVSGAAKYRLYKRVAGTSKWSKVTDTTSCSATATGLTDGEVYEFAVRAYNKAGESGALSAEKSYRYLSTPAVKISSAYGGLNVTWNVIPNATSYKVYRKASGESKWTTVATVTSASYLDVAATSGKTYYYAVSAFDGSSRSTYTSSKALNYLATPKVSSVANASSVITVKWGKVAGATSYIVYRKAGSATSWSKVATVSGTSYSDKNITAGTKYVYTVKATNSNTSSGYNTTGWTCVRMTAPTVKLANATTGVKVSWSEVKGATKYGIYRKASGESSWKAIKTVSSSVRVYVDTTAVSGTSYTYMVKGLYGSCSGLYKSSSALTYIAAPQISSVANATSAITVKWGKVTGATSYIVYRKAGTATSWSKVATVKTNYYNDSNITAGTKYTYTVKAYNGSVYSAYDTVGKGAVRMTATTVKVSNTAEGVKLSWGAVKGATQYSVYRKTVDGSWEVLATVTEKTFLDETAVSNTSYIYTVKGLTDGVLGLGKSSSAILYLAAPALIDVMEEEGNSVFTWQAIEGADSYTVYRKLPDGIWEVAGVTEGTSYTDEGATGYLYTVRAMKDGKIVSSYDATGVAFVSEPV